jgi:hypothetical protein
MSLTSKLTNITLLVDIYHQKTLYLSIIYIINSIVSVNKITELFYKLQNENLTN